MTQIIDAYLGLMALRQAGYRSTATAIAELVDNSIEAEANDIDIIVQVYEEVFFQVMMKSLDIFLYILFISQELQSQISQYDHKWS